MKSISNMETMGSNLLARKNANHTIQVDTLDNASQLLIVSFLSFLFNSNFPRDISSIHYR